MNNDLISREALKNVISEKLGIYIDGTLNNRLLFDIIDNAPTVEPIVEPCYQTTSCLDCKMYDKEKHNCPRFCEVIRNLVNEVKERPQGEWGKHGECPFCSYIRKWKEDNFCGNCGAHLRKGDKEE